MRLSLSLPDSARNNTPTPPGEQSQKPNGSAKIRATDGSSEIVAEEGHELAIIFKLAVEVNASFLRRQTKLAARLIISATTVTLKKNATIACNVTRRRNSFELMLTSEVCEAAPIEVEN